MEPPQVGELAPPDRLLLGPGPSEAHPRVRNAMSAPLVGHLDPAFVEIMDEVQALLRYVFRTDNEWTIPVSGTGSAAMETAFANLIEPGDTALVPGNGYFGERMASMVERAGGEVAVVDAPWGQPLAVEDVAAAVDDADPDVVGVVHAETSTGVLQPDMAAIADHAHDADALVVADTVTSLGGVDVRVDDWGIDVAYAGPQKCLSCPPGASPLTLNDRAMAKVQARDAAVRSWYLDLSLLESYWGEERAYHHTAPVSNAYALREALRLVVEEGLDERHARHRHVAEGLRHGVEGMLLSLNPDAEYWLPTLNAVRLPPGVDADAVIEHVLESYGIEIAGGLGDLAGDILRIGCMGHSARPANVLALLAALGDALEAQDAPVEPDPGIAAARAHYRDHDP